MHTNIIICTNINVYINIYITPYLKYTISEMCISSTRHHIIAETNSNLMTSISYLSLKSCTINGAN